MNIVLTDINKSFGERAVLKGFSAELAEGCTTVIMGGSGCGKSTLAGIILGTVTPDSGSITGVPEKVSAVFQENALCEDYDACRNIRFVTGGRKVSRGNEEKLLERLGISREDARKPVRDLSGGMKRRVAIARALAADYGFIVFDEAFRELDAETKRRVMAVVKEETASRTVLMITHDADEAEYFADKLITM